MQAKRDHHNHLSIDLITSRTNWYSKSISNIFQISPSNHSNTNHHQQFSSFNSFNSFNYDNINLSVKKTNIIKLKREHIKNKLLKKETTKKKLDCFHKTILKEKLDCNYSSLFLTKTQDMTMPLLSPIPKSINIDIPRTGLSTYKVYPIETAKAFTQRCCDMARMVYLKREQKRALMNLEEEENNKIDNLIEKKKSYLYHFNSLYFEFRSTFNHYFKYLRKVIDKELDKSEEIKKCKAEKVKEMNHLYETIEKKKEISTSMHLIQTLFTCAKEALSVNSDKSNTNANIIHNNKTYSPKKILFQELFSDQSITEDNSKCNSGFFKKALNRLRINKSLNDHFASKYQKNPFVFDSPEEFFDHVATYENKIISLITEYDKRKAYNKELKSHFEEIAKFCNSNIIIEENFLLEKEKEREAVIEKYKALIVRKEQILHQKLIKIRRKEFKVPTNPSYLTSNQSDIIVLAFKYNSLSKEYPIPFTCVYAKLLEIIKNIELNGPIFVCFDNTTSFCSFDINDLHALYKKKFNIKNEEEVIEILLLLLKVIERSFKEIMLYLRRMRDNPSTKTIIMKLQENIEKEKKILGMTHHREIIDIIRRLIMKNVDEKSHRFSLRQKRKVNIHSYIKRDNNHSLIDKKKYEDNSV